MAPAKGSNLELCSNTIALGNSIAVHALEYLSIAKHPRDGFREVAIEFLAASRALFPARAGLSRSSGKLPNNVNQELRERFLQAKSAFVVLDHMVNKLLSNEKSSGLGKIGKGLLMIFSDNELDKLKTTLAQVRAALSVSALMFASTLGDSKLDAAGGIGYTALAAILEVDDPTKGDTAASPQTARENTMAQLAPERRPLPATPSLPLATDLYGPRLSSLQGLNSTSPAEAPSLERVPLSGSTVGTMSSRMNAMSRSRSHRSSLAIDSSHSGSDIASILSLHQQLDSPKSNTSEPVPKQALRITVDTSKAPRLRPKYNGHIPDSSNMALASAVHQKDHKMVEQLLDCGVSAQSSLLGTAIFNHDLQTLQLLLAFGAEPGAKDMDGAAPLHTATKHACYEAAQLLIKYGATVDCTGPTGETPLAICLTGNRFNFAMLYLQHGADCNAIMRNGETPFTQAMNKTTSLNLAEAMMIYEADPNKKNEHGETPLFKAVNAARHDLLTLLLDAGADPNMPGPKILLWPAVHTNQLQMVETLLERGADLRRAPGLLELATSSNHRDLIDLLLKKGADPNSKKDGIYTPLCSAIRDNREELVHLLLAKGADPNLPALEFPMYECVTYHRTYLMPKIMVAGGNPHEPKGIVEHAVAQNDKDALIFLLDHNCDANARNDKNHTALTTAIRESRVDMIGILLSHGADPAVRGQDWPISLAVHNPEILAKLLPYIPTEKINKGAVEMAVVANQLDSVKLLIAKGMDVEGKTGGVFSPLTTSIRENRKQIFRYLCDEAGADPNSPGEHLPIIKAIRRHREDDMSYIEHLIAKGADINLMYRGWNAVLQALDNGDMQILRLLATKGHPDLSARDEHGRSVKEMMRERGLEEETQVLLGGRRTKNPETNATIGHLWDLGSPRDWSELDGIDVEDDDVSISERYDESRRSSCTVRSRAPSSVCLSPNEARFW